jgi:hypothetical protein
MNLEKGLCGKNWVPDPDPGRNSGTGSDPRSENIAKGDMNPVGCNVVTRYCI